MKVNGLRVSETAKVDLPMFEKPIRVFYNRAGQVVIYGEETDYLDFQDDEGVNIVTLKRLRLDKLSNADRKAFIEARKLIRQMLESWNSERDYPRVEVRIQNIDFS